MTLVDDGVLVGTVLKIRFSFIVPTKGNSTYSQCVTFPLFVYLKGLIKASAQWSAETEPIQTLSEKYVDSIHF